MAIKKATLQHVVAIPYPAQGHINPMLQLCQQLIPHGFTFTFVNTHHIHQRVHSATPLQDAGVDGAQLHANDHAHASMIHGHGDNHVLHVEQDEILVDDTLNQQPAKESHAKDARHEEGHNMHLHKGWNPIHMVFVEGGCAPEHHAHKSTKNEAFLAAQAMKEHVEQLISDIMEEQSVAFVLTDLLLGWGNASATKFGLPWVSFWSSSAATCAAFVHFADLAEQGKTIPVAGEQDGEVPIFDGIPGLPATSLHCVPKSWDDRGNLFYNQFLEYFHAAEKARFVLFNTFVELEGQVLQALCRRYSTLAVGPLLPARYMNEDVHTHPDRIRSYEEELLTRVSMFREDRTCMDWLNKQAPSSVLFISFGSISARTETQLEELAHGVEASGCPFLWVRRPDISAEATPGTGLGTQQSNGLIVPWAPQLEILAHPAVGGFITHCGWNSTMESVAMGVPMLCWADTTERMSNQRFVVEVWKCGLDMVSDGRRHTQHIDEAVLVTREEIEKSIRCLMSEESGAPIRHRAAKLRESAVSAFRDSHTPFNQFVQAMLQESVL